MVGTKEGRPVSAVPWGAGPGTRQAPRAALGDARQVGALGALSPGSSPTSQAVKRGLGGPDVGMFARGAPSGAAASPPRPRRRPVSAVSRLPSSPPRRMGPPAAARGRGEDGDGEGGCARDRGDLASSSARGDAGVDARSQTRLAMNRAFDTVRDVGRGSFGSATELRHKASGRRYVLKRIRLARQSGAMRRNSAFEVEMARNLRHPFVVRTRGTWTEVGGSQLCILMDCYRRGDLMRTLIEYAGGGKRFKEDTLKLWAVQLLLALEYLHGERVLHRDIKTSNVFLNEHGGVELGDFGLAQRLEHGEMEASQVGTPMYMCPSRFAGIPYDYKSDVWSLGCVLYELSAHQSPFAAFNVEGVRAKVERVSPKPLPKCYSREWSFLVRRMLKKAPEDRPSVADLLDTPCLQDMLRKVRAYLSTADAALVDEAELFWYDPTAPASADAGLAGPRPPAARPFSATVPAKVAEGPAAAAAGHARGAPPSTRLMSRPSTSFYPSHQQRKKPLSMGAHDAAAAPTPKSWSDPTEYDLAQSSDESPDIPVDDEDSDVDEDSDSLGQGVAEEESSPAARPGASPAPRVETVKMQVEANKGKDSPPLPRVHSPSPSHSPGGLVWTSPRSSPRQASLDDYKMFSAEKKPPVDPDTHAALLSHAEELRVQLEAARGTLAEARSLFRRSKFSHLGDLLDNFHIALAVQRRDGDA